MRTSTLSEEIVYFAGYKATATSPVPVHRAKGFLWFPTVFRQADGDLVAVMQTYADIHTTVTGWMLATSSDDGNSWQSFSPNNHSAVSLHLPLPSGEALLLPYYFYPCPQGMQGAGYRLSPGNADPQPLDEKVVVTGWPRPLSIITPETGYAGFVCNRQWVRLKDGRYLTTYYGNFEGTSRYALVAGASADGVRWEISSIIADETCKLTGEEGPCEAALCRLNDGRLMCIFRMGMAPKGTSYGQAWSSDEGKTWTTPISMPGIFSVEPSLATLPDGTAVLSGGRPGLSCWINRNGTGFGWDHIDLLTLHNRFHPDERIEYSEEFTGYQTTAYTTVIALDAQTLLCIYDRIPLGWNGVPDDSPEINSVWALRLQIDDWQSL